MFGSRLEDMTVVLHCCQGDLGDTRVPPGSSQDTGLAPGLGVRGPGQDGVHVFLAITEASDHMYDLFKPGSPQITAGGGKATALSPPSSRGGVVQQLGGGQVVGPIPPTSYDEDLDRDTAPSVGPPYLGLPHQVPAACMKPPAGDMVGQLPGGHLAAEV